MTDKNSLRYRFKGAPDLCLSGYGLDECGNGGYSFSIFDDEFVSELKKGVPALSVLIRSGRVYAVKVYDFSFPNEPGHRFVYKGLLSECIGLGSLVSDILPFTSLEFDEAEEWFIPVVIMVPLKLRGGGFLWRSSRTSLLQLLV